MMILPKMENLPFRTLMLVLPLSGRKWLLWSSADWRSFEVLWTKQLKDELLIFSFIPLGSCAEVSKLGYVVCYGWVFWRGSRWSLSPVHNTKLSIQSTKIDQLVANWTAVNESFEEDLADPCLHSQHRATIKNTRIDQQMLHCLSKGFQSSYFSSWEAVLSRNSQGEIGRGPWLRPKTFSWDDWRALEFEVDLLCCLWFCDNIFPFRNDFWRRQENKDYAVSERLTSLLWAGPNQ